MKISKYELEKIIHEEVTAAVKLLTLKEQEDFIPADQVGDELIKMIMKHGKDKVGYEVAKKIFDHLLKVLSPQGQPIGMDRKQLELAVQGLIEDPSKMR